MVTGSVLVNGAPPGRLPLNMQLHDSIASLFHDQDLEVTCEGGIYTTLRTLRGCHYDFQLVDKELHVRERQATVTLQLCSAKWYHRFRKQFPASITDKYSLWFWPDRESVLLRPRSIQSKSVHFVVQLESGRARCFEVARGDEDLAYDAIISRCETYYVYVQPHEVLVRVFGKFEETRFVHVMRVAGGRLRVHLPRCGLRFDEDGQGHLQSVEFPGYMLATNQFLVGQMHRFQRYLVLDHRLNGSEKVGRRLLVPQGRVVRHRGLVDIDMPEAATGVVTVAIFDEHPRLKLFTTESSESRLLLAAIYAASSSAMSWMKLGMTGEEAALDLVHRCQTCRPLSTSAVASLVDVAHWCRHSPCLRLKVAQMCEGTRRLGFLYPSEAPSGGGAARSTALDDELEASASEVYDDRSRFASSARWRIFTCSRSPHTWSAAADVSRSHIAQYAVDECFLQTHEDKLRAYVILSDRRGEWMDDGCPVSSVGDSAMSKEVVEDLHASWEVYKNQDRTQSISVSPLQLARELQPMRASVVRKRKDVEKYLLDSLRDAFAERLLSAIDCAPTPTITDILRCVVDGEFMSRIAPRFRHQCRARFIKAALHFMELVVLEDKLERIISAAMTTPPPPTEFFAQELTCAREWKPAEHPYWLVFEVEERLQIRPEQYLIARHLIDTPGTVCQLNMGRGKTRVILPMLFLYYRHNANNRVVRAHFLTPLLSETRLFFHQVLSAGVLRLPFLELPYNRSMALGIGEIQLMQEAVNDLKNTGGFLITSREQRLSLELKRRELEEDSSVDGHHEICEALDALCDPDQYIDVFDESDAVLDHKFHLVYALGTPTTVDGGCDRWFAAEALMRVMMSPGSWNTRVFFRTHRDTYYKHPEYSTRPGSFNGFRLNATTKSSVPTRSAFKAALVKDLLDSPPSELIWLKKVNEHPHIRDDLVVVLSDAAIEAAVIFDQLPTEWEGYRQQLLAIRGLVAFGVLENCFEKRNRVEYGLPHPGTRQRKLAVPFVAADLPSDRSDFIHPDVCIVLTLLSYYHAGLQNGEIQQAFDSLLSLGRPERELYYAEWRNSIDDTVRDPHKRGLIRSLDNISLDNAQQFARVCDIYRYSMEVINFFLNKVVFPRDMVQYSQCISRSAWDLVDGPDCVGFSGTNDTHRLLPVAVTQREPDVPLLRGTNGRMVDLLMACTLGYETLCDQATDGEDARDAIWEMLLRKALEKKCDALIDTGALLAGVAPEQAARFLINHSDFTAAGVAYYDTTAAFDRWVVLERERQVTCSLKSSSLRESDTFVIFDEARSRGSDMKLHANAVALLTLGPTITKDKLMQGAGRMRQLGHDQKLWMTSTRDVETIALEFISTGAEQVARSLDVNHIVNWVVANTARQTTNGTVEWAANGIHHCSRTLDPQQELRSEEWKLEHYAASALETTIEDVVQRKVERITSSTFISDDVVLEMLEKIQGRAAISGREACVKAVGLTDEYECEYQVEEEEEAEKEEAYTEITPANERRWDARLLLNVGSLKALRRRVELLDVKEVATRKLHPVELSKLAWHKTKVEGTANFWATIVEPDAKSFVLDAYLRVIDVLVVFGDGSVLLLSEREADDVLKMLLVGTFDTEKTWKGHFGVVHLSFAMKAIQTDRKWIFLRDIPLSIEFQKGVIRSSGLKISVATILACRLLNGDAHLDSDTQREFKARELRELLAPLPRREASLREFFEARRYPQNWPRSFLHDLAKNMDLEHTTWR